jgi:UDP-GlcNAc:undecaprenyl-phosphate GlcNAc-1-phosphate transferase
MSFELKPFVVFITALFSVYLILPKLANIAKRIGLLDHPGGRKIHKDPCPLVGGLGMIMAFSFVSILYIPLSGMRGYFAGLILLVIVGFFDDFKELGHWRKFVAQIIATFCMIIFSQALLSDFGNLLGFVSLKIPWAWMSICVTIFCVVGVINSLNMIDGLDGLAGGLSFIALVTFAVLASISGDTTSMLVAIGLAGAVFGFLRYNWDSAKVFMGDAGSLCLGFSLAYLAIVLTQLENSVIPPIAALLVLAVPITDTLTLMIKRMLKRKNPFKADRYHLHHIFMRYGLDKKNVVKVILFSSIISSCVAVAGVIYSIPEWILFVIFIICFSCYFTASFFILKILRFRLRFRRKREWSQNAIVREGIRYICQILDFFSFFRKEMRYEVHIPVVCSDEDSGITVAGHILNISQSGCIIKVPELNYRRHDFTLKMILSINDQKIDFSVSGEGVWFVVEDDQSYLHGIQFVDLDEPQLKILNEYIDCLHPEMEIETFSTKRKRLFEKSSD